MKESRGLTLVTIAVLLVFIGTFLGILLHFYEETSRSKAPDGALVHHTFYYGTEQRDKALAMHTAECTLEHMKLTHPVKPEVFMETCLTVKGWTKQKRTQ